MIGLENYRSDSIAFARPKLDRPSKVTMPLGVALRLVGFSRRSKIMKIQASRVTLKPRFLGERPRHFTASCFKYLHVYLPLSDLSYQDILAQIKRPCFHELCPSMGYEESIANYLSKRCKNKSETCF